MWWIRRSALRAAGGLLVVVVAASCLGPTEIEITITSTACDTLRSVDIYVGGDVLATAPTASVQGCLNATQANGTVGSLVIVPSASQRDHVQISVVGSLAGSSCDGPSPNGSGCIVSKRALSFSPHRPLRVPIELDAACAGHACPGNSYCAVVSGVPTCVTDDCSVNPALCGLEGGVDALDEMPDLDASDASDASDGQVCAAPDPDAGTPKASWNFDFVPDGDNQVHEDNDNFSPQPLLTTSKLTTDPGACNVALETTGGNPQSLVMNEQSLATGSFIVAFSFRASVDTELLALRAPKLSHGGFVVSLSNGALNVVIDGPSSSNALIDGVDMTKGWHAFAMQVVTVGSTSTYAFWRDGQQIKATGQPPYLPASALLTAGADAWIDQVELFLN